MKILVERIKHIGDMLMVEPLIRALKNAYPMSSITFLVSRYTVPIAEMMQSVDDIIDFEALDGLNEDVAISLIRKKQFTHFITLTPHKKSVRLAKKAKIPNRIGTSRKIYNWLYCNKRVRYSKGKLPIHESQMNFKPLKALCLNDSPSIYDATPKLTCSQKSNHTLIPTHGVDKNRFSIVLHPGSNLSGNEWHESCYLEFVEKLDINSYQIFVTGQKKEAQRYQKLFSHDKTINLTNKFSLKELTYFLNSCDGLLASGTGPLHIMAALGKNCLGLYPYPGIARRWRPLGEKAKYLVGGSSNTVHHNNCPHGVACACMKKITPSSVLSIVESWRHQTSKRDMMRHACEPGECV